MDVDLSTDLDALLPLVAPLLSGHSDLAIGSRLARSARVVRGPKREVISRVLQRAAAAGPARAVQRRAVRVQGGPRRPRPGPAAAGARTRAGSSTPSCSCSPSAADCGSTRCPSTGSTTPTAASTSSRPPSPTCGASPGWPATSPPAGCRSPGCGPSSPRPPRASFAGQALRFGVVGVASTVAYLALYVLLRAVLPAVPANALALLVTALANTAANRRFTFEVAGRAGAVRHHAHGLALFAAGLALSSGALAALHAANPAPAARARGRRARRGQPRHHRAAVRRHALVGLRTRRPVPPAPVTPLSPARASPALKDAR